MSVIKTYKGQLPIGEQEKIHLSTNDGLTGYRLKDFKIMGNKPGHTSGGTYEYIAKIFLTDQTGNITDNVDFSDADLLAAIYQQDSASAADNPAQVIMLDKETFNQDIFIYIVDASGNTEPCNFYIELEQFSIDMNSSTYHTLKNIRSLTGPGFEYL